MSLPLKLWYRQAAGSDWNRALPIGSGRLGAMVFGNVDHERIQLNEDSLWNGGPRDRCNPDAAAALPEVRRLLFAGRIAEANVLVNDALAGIPDSMRCYEPLGDLSIDFYHPGRPIGTAAKTADAYRRELDLRRAVATVDYMLAGIRYTRRHLAGAVHGAIVIRLESDGPEGISFRLRLERGPRESYSTRYADHSGRCGDDGAGEGLIMTGRSGGEGGVHFATCVRATSEGGQLRVIGDTLVVEAAQAVTLVLAASTSFREADPTAAVREGSAHALACGWEGLLADHLEEYSRSFDRVDLRLGDLSAVAEADGRPTDERLARHHQYGDDLSLEALYFHFGRYLLISSSRPGSLPANLQGVWNQDFQPAWGSKYTLNINLEMNYWLAETANLAECHHPLFELIERLSETGRRPAREMYGCQGFVAHHNTDLWADPYPTDRNPAGSYWYMGGAWLALHLWEHFAFGGDRAFLARAYPILKEASRFFLDFLVENESGRLVVCPTCSPENTYRLPNGESGVLCAGSRMDSQILDTLFRRTDEAASLLGMDPDLRTELASARERLPPLVSGSDGRLLEWMEPYDEVDPRHRHISHLFALHPGDGIDDRRDPTPARAARATLEGRGDEGTGWSMAWKVNFWARLHDGARAGRLLRNLLSPASYVQGNEVMEYAGGGGSYPNLFCAHPPFQIDGNLGGAAAIAETLVQSHRQTKSTGAGRLFEICLLPALPLQWSAGIVRGLRARGGFEVGCAWDGGSLTRADLFSRHGGACSVRYGNRVKEVVLKMGERLILNEKLEPIDDGHPP